MVDKIAPLALCEHHMVSWSQQGVMARADGSMLHALDLIEYAGELRVGVQLR